MRPFRDLSLALIGALIVVFAGAPRAQQVPQFRAAVDLVHLDVSVLDRDRRPVRGLTAEDFVILEDGKPQAVSTFAAIEYPDAEPPTAPWMRDVPPDTRRNDVLEERRLFVLVIDDATAELNMQALKTTKDAARDFIERLGPNDLAAVLYTLQNQHAQDFTADRARLFAAIDKFSGGFRGMSGGGETNEYYYRSSVDVIRRITEALVEIPQRRKTLVYIGQGVPVNPAAVAPTSISSGNLQAVNEAAMHALLVERMQAMFALAQRANVNVYTIDTCGLRLPPIPTVGPPQTCIAGLEQEYLRDLAHATGGRAAIDMNDVGPAVEQIFIENGSYYLLGFNSTNPRQQGRTRRLEVKVNRPGVEVRTRTQYSELNPAREQREAERDTTSPLAKAVSGLLPKGDVPLQAWAASYGVSGRRESHVAITLGIRQTLGARPLATTETVDVTIDAFTPEGRRRSGKSVSAAVTLRPGPAGVVGYEVVSHLTLAPGRYQLRVAARLQSDDTTGSIYYDLEVPDYSRNAVSLSGLALSASPGVTSTLAEAMPWLPVRPTTARLFERTDTVTAFARLYRQTQSSQGAFRRGGMTSAPLTVRARIVDANGREVWTIAEAVDAARASQGETDLAINIPIATLQPGAHLLTFEVGGVSESVRFTVR
jgi:VWFA-related protein